VPRGIAAAQVHHGCVRSQESRDANTVAIATALGIFVWLVAAGTALLWAATRSDPSTSPMLGLIVTVAASVAVAFLVRARRPGNRASARK
jgi:hypothetical protein